MKRVDFLQPTGWKAEVSRCRRVNALEVLCPRVLYVISGQKRKHPYTTDVGLQLAPSAETTTIQFAGTGEAN